MNAPVRLAGRQQVRLHVEDFLALADAGALTKYERTELIDGNIYAWPPQYRPEARVKMDLLDRLHTSFVDRQAALKVFTGTTIGMPPFDAPMPDLTVITEAEAAGKGIIPLHAVRLVVEVGAATLTDDLGVKLRIYAAHGVPECWVADAAKGVVHQMWVPTHDGYAETAIVDVRGVLSFRTLDMLID